ncbi:MAG: hypothetical protein JNL79_31535 [Myxococcales bacterium]|nr:hypothetical protein [Myxococcales bacterium]
MRTLAVLSVVALSVSSARAACPVPEGADPALAQQSDEVRQAKVEQALVAAGRDTTTWAWAWRASFLFTGTVQAGLLPGARSEADRIDLQLGMGKSVVAFGFALVTRLPAEKHHDTFSPTPSPEPRSCAKLAELELRLRDDAIGERKGRHWFMHALSIAFNVGVGAVAWKLHGRVGSALFGVISGSAVGELRLFTQPLTANRAWDAYLHGESVTARRVTPWITVVPSGAMLGADLQL